MTTVAVEVAELVGTPNPNAGVAKIDVTYSLPFPIHAAMEVTGHTADQVTVHPTWMGGGFGRKIGTDYVTQAVQLSKAIK